MLGWVFGIYVMLVTSQPCWARPWPTWLESLAFMSRLLHPGSVAPGLGTLAWVFGICVMLATSQSHCARIGLLVAVTTPLPRAATHALLKPADGSESSLGN